MTLVDYAAMAAHWRRQPPAEILIAAYLGYKPPAEPETMDVAELAAMFGATVPQDW